jgi:hypothetical protein
VLDRSSNLLADNLTNVIAGGPGLSLFCRSAVAAANPGKSPLYRKSSS